MLCPGSPLQSKHPPFTMPARPHARRSSYRRRSLLSRQARQKGKQLALCRSKADPGGEESALQGRGVASLPPVSNPSAVVTEGAGFSRQVGCYGGASAFAADQGGGQALALDRVDQSCGVAAGDHAGLVAPGGPLLLQRTPPRIGPALDTPKRASSAVIWARRSDAAALERAKTPAFDAFAPMGKTHECPAQARRTGMWERRSFRRSGCRTRGTRQARARRLAPPAGRCDSRRRSPE
jgi:hypothetical protein